MIKVGIIGSTGYAGQEIVRILLGHKEAEIRLWILQDSLSDFLLSKIFEEPCCPQIGES